MQGEECELGGFKGRTNKLVDGCYAWWCGGEFALLEALGVSGYAHSQGQVRPEEGNEDDEEGWDDVDGKQVVLLNFPDGVTKESLPAL